MTQNIDNDLTPFRTFSLDPGLYLNIFVVYFTENAPIILFYLLFEEMLATNTNVSRTVSIKKVVKKGQLY
jgi:hypothetical protein